MSLPIKNRTSEGPHSACSAYGYGICTLSIIVAYAIIGYYNPILAYGEENAVRDAKEAGANGFIMVDLPPEEAIRFRGLCRVHGYGRGPILLAVSQSFQIIVCATDCTVDITSSNKALGVHCRLFYLHCFKGDHVFFYQVVVDIRPVDGYYRFFRQGEYQ